MRISWGMGYNISNGVSLLMENAHLCQVDGDIGAFGGRTSFEERLADPHAWRVKGVLGQVCCRVATEAAPRPAAVFEELAPSGHTGGQRETHAVELQRTAEKLRGCTCRVRTHTHIWLERSQLFQRWL